MEHVIAILGLSVLCGLWIVIQRASGHLDRDDDEEAHPGGCVCRSGQAADCKSRTSGEPCKNAPSLSDS